MPQRRSTAVESAETWGPPSMQDTFAWPNILESLARSRDAEVNPLHMAFPFLGYRSVRDEGHDPIL